MGDPDDDDAFFRQAREEMFPKMRDAFLSLTVLDGSDPNPQFCLELGAAIMYDKPIIALNMTGHPVPESLKKVAVAVLNVPPDVDVMTDPALQARMRGALRAAGVPLPPDA